MAEQPNATEFERRLGRLGDVVARAVHIAATLKVASSPTFDGRRTKESKAAVVSRADLNAPAATPPEVEQWVRGLGTFYKSLAAGSEPDKEVLLRQLDRQVGELTDEISRASERSTEAIGRLMGRLTGKARVYPEYVAQLEQGLRTQVDKAASDLVPGQAASVFTGLVVNRLLGSVEDDTLVRVGEALQGSLELAQAPAKPAEIEAPAQGGVVAHSTPAVGPGALTLTDLDELDAPAPRGALRRFDPAALDAEPRALPDLSGPGEADATIEPAEPAEPGREIKEPEPPDPGLGT